MKQLRFHTAWVKFSEVTGKWRFRQFLLLLTVLWPSAPSFAQAEKDTNAQNAAQHLRMAQEYLGEQKTDLAINEFQQVVALDPSNIEAEGNLGVLLYFHGDFQASIPMLRAAVNARPTLWKLQSLLGMADARVGDEPASRTELEAAFSHLTEAKVQLEVGETLVEDYTASGDFEKAAAVTSTLLLIRPADPALLYLSFRIHSDLANQSLLSMAMAAPQSGQMYQIMAGEAARQGDTQRAIADYRRAATIDSKLPGLHTDLGNLLFHSQDDKLRAEAPAEFQAALAVNPGDEKAQLAMGVIAAKNGDLNTALADDSQALKLEPNDSDACEELAKVLAQMDRSDEATKLLERAVQIDPANYVAHFRLSTLYRKQGKKDEAKEQVDLYTKYKQMKDDLTQVFHDLRMNSIADPTDLETETKP